MKTLLTTLFLGGSLIFGENVFAQDTKINSTISVFQMDSAEKKMDSLEQNAIDNYNKSKIKYNECAEQQHFYKNCADTLIRYLLNSKKTLEEYNKMIQENQKYELSYGTVIVARTLDSEKTKEWIENEDKLLQLIKDFLKDPSTKRQEAWMNQRIYTTNLINSWYSKENILNIK